MQDVDGGHGALGTNLLDADFGAAAFFRQDVDDGLGPVCAIAQEAQIGQGFLGAAEAALALAELVAEGDEQEAIPPALILRQRQDAGHVVALGGFFFLGEVPDEVAAVGVAGGHAVEEKWVDVVVERLVVEEELRQQAEVAAPAPLPAAVDFEKREMVVPVDLVAGRVQQRAFGPVPLKRERRRRVAEAELANVRHFRAREVGWVRREVPRFDLKRAHLDSGEVAHPRHLGLVLRHAAPRP